MRQFLAFACLLASAIAVLGQGTSDPVFYNITDKDKVCTSPDNCTYAFVQCCGGSSCNYSAVNVQAARTIAGVYQESLATTGTCASIVCPQILTACAIPSVTCTLSNVAVSGQCNIVTRLPPPTTTVSPSPPPTCSVSYDRLCATSCVSSSLANTVMCQSNNQTINCINNCNKNLAQCSASPTSTSGSMCAFVSSTLLEWQSCQKACSASQIASPVPAPAPLCYTGTDSLCGATCTSTAPASDVSQCLPSDPLVRCKNACIAQWTMCGLSTSTNALCGFIPTNETNYRSCLSQCALTASPVVASPVPTTQVDLCYAGSDSMCASTCTSSPPEVNVAQCLPTDAGVRCKNACIAQWTKCSSSRTLTGASQCSFIPFNETSYKTCLSLCTAPSPITSTCILTSSSTCESICVVGSSTTALSDCQPRDPYVVCVNECKTAYTTCKPLLASTNLGQGCGLVPSNLTLYQQCVGKCTLTPTPTTPPPSKCIVQTDSVSCQDVCVSDVGVTFSGPLCTPDTLTSCLNQCQTTAVCSLTSNGCSYVPRDPLAYRECQAKCLAVPVPTAAPIQCFRTGCSGEICSSVQMQSDCSLTCEKACYRNATCASVSLSSSVTVSGTSCAWLQTLELSACIKACIPAIPAPTTSSTCKISGCSRELCIPSTSQDPGCISIPEPTCENKCLVYAQCSELPSTLLFPGETVSCGWVPNPTNPGPYAECLTQCRQINNPCFVSGCGSVCATVASLRPCPTSLTCTEKCNYAYSTCNLTSSGTCAFLPSRGLRECLATCSPTLSPAPSSSVCPMGVSLVQCLLDPCTVTKCTAYPNARCTPDYCGSCRAVFDVNGQVVNCDEGCGSLGCRDCLAKSTCAYCNGNYSTSSGVYTSFGVCVAANSDAATKCLASNSRLLSSGSTCPVTSTSGPSTTSDPTPFQNEVAASNLTVRQKFVIVITLIVNQTASGSVRFNLVKMFVDLIGLGTPDANDREEVCLILKDALLKINADIPRDLLTCVLAEKTTAKRDTSYVADLSYPAGSTASQDSASALVASMALVAVAAVAALF